MRKMTQATLFLKALLPFLIMLLSACGRGVKLLDLPESTVALNLSEEQRKIIQPKISHLQDIVEGYKFERDEVEANYRRYRSQMRLSRVSRYEGRGLSNGMGRERNNMRTKLRRFAMQRRAYAKEISQLIDEIKANLTADQLVVFAEIKQPALELPDVLKQRSYDEFARIPGTRGARPDDFWQPLR